MAGIAGIVAKFDSRIEDVDYLQAFEKMFKKLFFSSKQKSTIHNGFGVCFGNVIPLAQKNNDNFHHDDSSDIFCIIDGFVFVKNSEKEKIKEVYSKGESLTDHQCLISLFKIHGQKINNHLTGNYNVFIYDRSKKESILFNDRLGFLPLYIYENINVILFASKIECIIASGLINRLTFDPVTIAEHLFFNYTLSDFTYIKEVHTLPGATLMQVSGKNVQKHQYWDISTLIDLNPVEKRESLELINCGLKRSINKFLDRNSDLVNFSLTGGWDSRVVLSYLLPGYLERLRAYSFGAPGVADITVPQLIAQQEGFNYRPFLLDQHYIDVDFLPDAVNTIMLSNGTRNYKRTHYVHVVQQIGQDSPWLLTGIFGDEVFKVGRPQGGAVISQNAVDFIDSGFNVDFISDRFVKLGLLEHFNAMEGNLLNEFKGRLQLIRNTFLKYQTTGEKYFAFRFTINLRKYFGNEANSYNDFAYCFSPFFDYDFLEKYAKTHYMVSRFDFTRPNIIWQAQSSRLYYEITRRNHSNLTKYSSSRGYSMRDTSTLGGLFTILYRKYLSKSSWKSVDGFNTSITDEIFKTLPEFMDNKILKNNDILFGMHSEKCNLNSINFWKGKINALYLVS